MTTNMVPFPMLRVLRLGAPYPFTDDVLFRGNVTTLEYLDFYVDKDIVTMFNRYKTFENKSKVLRHVLIKEDTFNESISLVSKSDMIGFLRNLTSFAQRLSVWSSTLRKMPIVAMEYGQAFINIKVFEVHLDRPSLFDNLYVLKALPALVDLRSSFNGMGSELESISSEELPDYIASSYCDAGNNLQVLRVNYFSAQYAAQFVDYMLLLALACPKLHRVEASPGNLQIYHAEVAKRLESGPYSKYASQLNRMTNAIFE
ncbi:hypothetical protein GGF41_000583 [Coemansia sp. RSA 2531]|nr:hypothetical protein GGF41_000583 [Coemansia sp. RSA 2531]